MAGLWDWQYTNALYPYGNALSDEVIKKQRVWAKGHMIPGAEPREWRRDDYGNRMRYADYGDRSSPFGWEFDHIVATAIGGSDDISNLRPLHHEKNASLGGLLRGYLNP